jgi:hypothetical protein
MAREFLIQSALTVAGNTKVLDFATSGGKDKLKLSTKPMAISAQVKFAGIDDGRLQNSQKGANGFVTRPSAAGNPPTLEANSGAAGTDQPWAFGHLGGQTFIVDPTSSSAVASVLTAKPGDQVAIEDLSDDPVPLNQLWLFKEV